MTDIKELRHALSGDASFESTFTHEKAGELLDHIERQEALIAELHTSIAGAVQHGEQGWQRYEAANKMCLNQQKEIAGLNEVIAELRKDAESTLIIALPVYEKRRIVIGSDELIDGERIVCVAIVDPDTSTQEVG